MGLRKTKLLISDQYGRYVAAQRCAELLRAQYSGDGPIELRLEDSRYLPWDDLTEVYRDLRGQDTQHVWQVKRQRQPLEQEEMESLLHALHAHPTTIAHLALYRLVDIGGIGSLDKLSDMCWRLRQPGFDVNSRNLEWSVGERKWLKFIRKLLQCSEREVFELLRRLHLQELGPEQGLRLRAVQLLESHYVQPESAHDRLLAFLGNHPDGAVQITANLLEEQVLSGLERRPSMGQPSLHGLRTNYLGTVLESYHRISPLRLVTGLEAPMGSSPGLKEVFVMPALRGVVDESPFLRDRDRPDPSGASPSQHDDATTEQLLLAEDFASTPEEVPLLEVLLDPVRLIGRPRYVVEGQVGAGKSTLLEHLRFKLAERAKEDAQSPLPIRVEARELSSDWDTIWLRAFPRLDPRLMRSHSVGFVYLVDGLDEVEKDRARAVQDKLDELAHSPSTRALVMTGRPLTTYVEIPPATPRLRIAPWTRTQLDEFVERWRQHEPARAEALSRLAQMETLRPALGTPLTATFALILAYEDPNSLRSRSLLFQGINEKLIADWAKNRVAQGDPSGGAWANIAPALRQLALDSLRLGKEELNRSDIRRCFGRKAADRESEVLEQVHRRFGLLLYQKNGTYRFLLKGLAEHLAGAALLEEGKEAILSAAQEKWAAEPVRHALGLGMDRHGVAWAVPLIQALLPKPKFITLADIRSLLILTRVALDLGEESAHMARPVSDALCTLMSMGTSAWIQNALAGVVRELAQQGGPCWEALFQKLQPRLSPQCSSPQWYLAQENRSPDWWLEVLKHRNPDVRRVAIDRLEPSIDEPKVRVVLLYLLLDSKRAEALREPPAVHAALMLRKARRDAHFQQVLANLVAMMKFENSFSGCAAALAVHPGEVPAPLLAERLHGLSAFNCIHLSVLQELAMRPEGAAALAKSWPDWQDLDLVPEDPLVPAREPVGDTPPLPSWNRGVILKALGPFLARRSSAEREELGASNYDLNVVRGLCEAAWEHPQGMVEVIETEPYLRSAPDKASRQLGEAAARHPALRTALLHRWARNMDESSRNDFPGDAFALLASRGDIECANALAEWIRVTFWLSGHIAFTLPAAALQHPAVRPAAIERAREAWQKHTVGWLDENNRRTIIPGGMMSNVLRTLRAAWEEEGGLKEDILHWAEAGQHEELKLALIVFYDPPHPPRLVKLLLERLSDFMEQVRADEQQHHELATLLVFVERIGLGGHFHNVLKDIRTWPSWVRYQATALLVSGIHAQTNASELSRQEAAHWPTAWNSLFVPPPTLSQLVHAAPEAWSKRLLEILTWDGLPLSYIFQLARVLLPLLSVERREALQTKLHELVRNFDYGWINPGGQTPDNSIRCPDLYMQILFETGGRLG